MGRGFSFFFFRFCIFSKKIVDLKSKPDNWFLPSDEIPTGIPSDLHTVPWDSSCAGDGGVATLMLSSSLGWPAPDKNTPTTTASPPLCVCLQPLIPRSSRWQLFPLNQRCTVGLLCNIQSHHDAREPGQSEAEGWHATAVHPRPLPGQLGVMS